MDVNLVENTGLNFHVMSWRVLQQSVEQTSNWHNNIIELNAQRMVAKIATHVNDVGGGYASCVRGFDQLALPFCKRI